MLKVNNKDTRTTSFDAVYVSSFITLNKLLTLQVQSLEEERFFPYFSVASFLESHNFYITMIFIYIS